MSRIFLYLTIFLTGAAVLILEVTATRILAPFFGNTIFSLSSVLTVILTALSLGYYFGGRIADRFPHPRIFYFFITVSGLATFFIKIIGVVLLPVFSSIFSLAVGPLVSSLLLFLLPAFILGTLSPFAIKLSSGFFPPEKIGQASGIVFFWSTLGSIIGSLSTGFLLIPNFGIDKIIYGTAIGLAGTRLKFHPLPIFAVLILLLQILLVSSLSPSPDNPLIYSADGFYQKISVSQPHSTPAVRYLIQDRNVSAATYLESDDHVFPYTRYADLYRIFNPSARTALVIGAGAYTIPKALLNSDPSFRVDVIDIEPGLYELSEKYFRLKPSNRLRNFISDGRYFLTRNSKKYDLIFSDAYYSLLSIPAHLTTVEFFSLARSRLNPGGMFIGNFVGNLTPVIPSYFYSQLKTFTYVFPQTWVFALNPSRPDSVQNILIVGINSDSPAEFDTSSHADTFINTSAVNLSAYPVFTDNYNPAEYILAQTLTDKYR